MSASQNHPLGKVLDVFRYLRISWKLFLDRRVPVWTKAVPLLSAAYLIWPIDLLADPALGLGQLDDLAIILLGLRLFVSLCPAALVQQYEQALRTKDHRVEGDGEVVDTTYRVLDEDTSASKDQ